MEYDIILIMEKIKEIIVVEGRHDSNTLKQYFDCDTIETGGDQLIDTTIDRIARAQKERGVIIYRSRFTRGTDSSVDQ